MNQRDFNHLMAAWRARIRNLASRMAGGDHDLAVDLEQEGYMAVWEYKLRKNCHHQDAWIYRLVRDRMTDAKRRERRNGIVTPEARPSGRRRRRAGDALRSRRNMVPRHWNAMPEDDFDDLESIAEGPCANDERRVASDDGAVTIRDGPVIIDEGGVTFDEGT